MTKKTEPANQIIEYIRSNCTAADDKIISTIEDIVERDPIFGGIRITGTSKSGRKKLFNVAWLGLDKDLSGWISSTGRQINSPGNKILDVKELHPIIACRTLFERTDHTDIFTTEEISEDKIRAATRADKYWRKCGLIRKNEVKGDYILCIKRLYPQVLMIATLCEASFDIYAFMTPFGVSYIYHPEPSKKLLNKLAAYFALSKSLSLNAVKMALTTYDQNIIVALSL